MNLPAHNLTAESGVIGCLLWEGESCYHEARAAGLKADWFYDLRNLAVYRAIEALELAGTPATFHTVKNKMGESLADAGGDAHLIALARDSAPSPAMLPIFLDECRDALLKRKAGAIAAESADLVAGDASGEETLLKMSARAIEAVDSVSQKESAHGIILASRFTADLEKRKELADSGKRSGIVTGIKELDSMMDGLQFGDQHIIGARPGTGKTAFGICLVNEITLNQSIPSLVVSCEMSTEALMMRLCSVHTGVPLASLKRGHYTGGEMGRIIAFNAKLSKCPLYVVDAISGMTGQEAAGAIRQHARKHGVKFVLVDYLQKLKADTKSEKRTYEIADVSGSLRAASVATGAALVTLAQVNRDSDKGTEPRMPRASDLADSGQIERDADAILLLHRDRVEKSKAMLILAKQRDSETGDIPLYFNGPLTRFENPESNPAYED